MLGIAWPSAIQEIVILPIGASRFEEALQMGSETYHHLKAVIVEKYCARGCNVGEDGGFAPNISSFKGLDLVKEAISRTGYNERIKIAIDVAATDFCMGAKYDRDYKSPNKLGKNFKLADDMIKLYRERCAEYPIVSIEDPFDKEDCFAICQVVGDDLLMSNSQRMKKAIEESTCGALLLKINQIGTVTEAIEDSYKNLKILQKFEDSFIADFSVGLSTGQIKARAPCRGEQLAKYNQVSFHTRIIMSSILLFVSCFTAHNFKGLYTW